MTLVAFFGAIVWTIYMSFTALRRLPDYGIDLTSGRGSTTGCSTTSAWRRRSPNLVVLAVGSALAIVFGFILAAMIDREKRGEGFFRTIFLYPLAVSLIVTGLVWRWMFNPGLGIQNFLHQLGLTERQLQLARRRRRPRCTASSSPRSGSRPASTWR